MTCNRCAAKSASAAATVAAASHVESAWAGNRAHPRQCPTCRHFLRADGGCTYCDSKGDVARPSLYAPRQSLDNFWQQYSPAEQQRIRQVLAQAHGSAPLPMPRLPYHLHKLDERASQLGLTNHLIHANNYFRQQTGQELMHHDAQEMLEMPVGQWQGHLAQLTAQYNQPRRHDPAHDVQRLTPDMVANANTTRPSTPPQRPQSRIPTRPVRRVGRVAQPPSSPPQPQRPAICPRHNVLRHARNGECLKCAEEMSALDEEQKTLRVYRGVRYAMTGVSTLVGGIVGGPIGAVLSGGVISMGTGPMKRYEESRKRFFEQERERISRGEPTPPNANTMPGFTWLPKIFGRKIF